MKKSIKFGLVLEVISGFSQSQIIFVTKYEIEIDKIIDKIIRNIDFQKVFQIHLASENEIQFIGLKSGAISIQPITTAVELCKSHKTTIKIDKIISTK